MHKRAQSDTESQGDEKTEGRRQGWKKKCVLLDMLILTYKKYCLWCLDVLMPEYA